LRGELHRLPEVQYQEHVALRSEQYRLLEAVCFAVGGLRQGADARAAGGGFDEPHSRAVCCGVGDVGGRASRRTSCPHDVRLAARPISDLLDPALPHLADLPQVSLVGGQITASGLVEQR
jgi:hypothetical protein